MYSGVITHFQALPALPQPYSIITFESPPKPKYPEGLPNLPQTYSGRKIKGKTSTKDQKVVCADSEKVPITDEKPISVKPKGKKSPVKQKRFQKVAWI